MSDSAEPLSPPTQHAAAARFVAPLVSLVVLLVAAVAFAGAVVWSGGINEALSLAGLDSFFGDPPQVTAAAPKAKPAGSTAATSSATVAPSAATGIPSAAQAAMYREQLQSQGAINEIVGNEYSTLKLGNPKVLASSATVPVTATYRDGSSESGFMTLKQYNGLWYFFSLTASGSGSPARPGTIDSSVVSVITREQATPANQDMIKKGILGGGFKTATVTSVSKGSGTATINVNMTGGSSGAKKGQFVCISKRDGASTYWFVARFSAK